MRQHVVLRDVFAVAIHEPEADLRLSITLLSPCPQRIDLRRLRLHRHTERDQLGSPGDPGRLAIARSTERTGRCCSHTPAGYAGRAAAPACLRARGVEGRSWNAPLRWAPGGFQAFAKKRMRGSATTAGRKTRLDAIQSVRLTGYRRFSPMRPIVPRRSAASWRQPKDHTLLAAFAVISVEQRRFVVPPDAGARDCF